MVCMCANFISEHIDHKPFKTMAEKKTPHDNTFKTISADVNKCSILLNVFYCSPS